MISPPAHTVPKVKKLVISDEFADQRVDNFLLNYLKGVPKSRVYRIIRKGEVRINQGRIKPEYRLQVGDLLRIPPVRRDEEKAALLQPWNEQRTQDLESNILYEDDGLIIINKPSGMAVHGGSGVSFGVIEALRHVRGTDKPLELVHRLDKDTSGCLMIAKRRRILRALHAQLQAGEIQKVYWALVKGRWQGGRQVNAPLKKNQLSSGERIVRVSEEGQHAETQFRVIKQYADVALMEARPITGRTHQIRVHAAYVGCPIIGDSKYGDGIIDAEMKKLGINRLFLHAQQISLTLPGSEEAITIEATLDPELQKGLDRLNDKEIA